MHHPLIDPKELRKMPEEKVQEKLSELRKKRNMVMRSNYNLMVLEQIESMITLYQVELAERSAKRIAKEKDKGTDMDDLINIE
jgi:hypothetical protein|tara:strand:- start:895 stop:1143 length:249 start_codon:yes stop_codon:yes gene_type:complete